MAYKLQVLINRAQDDTSYHFKDATNWGLQCISVEPCVLSDTGHHLQFMRKLLMKLKTLCVDLFQCRDIGVISHDELIKVLNELQSVSTSGSFFF